LRYGFFGIVKTKT